MGTLPTEKTPIIDIPHLVGIPAPEHLGHQVIIVASIIARIDVFKAVPVVGKDLFEDAPGRRRGCSHQAASLRSMRVWISRSPKLSRRNAILTVERRRDNLNRE